MSVLLTKDDGTGAKQSSVIKDKSPRQKGQSKLQLNRDTIKIVNEKNAANLQVQIYIFVR